MGRRRGGKPRGDLVMATGLVSATKFRAAASGGLRGRGAGRTGSAGLEGSGGGRGPSRGGRWAVAFGGGGGGNLDIVYWAPSLSGPAEPPPSRTAGLRAAGGVGALAPLRALHLRRQTAEASETERVSHSSPPPFFPGEPPACPGLSERGRSALPPRGTAALWGRRRGGNLAPGEPRAGRAGGSAGAGKAAGPGGARGRGRGAPPLPPPGRAGLLRSCE